MTIATWFDILLDGMQKAIDFLYAIDLGGISLGSYIIVIFIISLCFTLFLHVVNTGSVVASSRIRKIRRDKSKGDSK